MVDNTSRDLARIIKQQRISIPLTLNELSVKSGVSQSYLGRIEQRERFPSVRILRKIAKNLGFEENELFMLAGYLSHRASIEPESSESYPHNKKLDPYVAKVLAQEPVEVQRTVVGILSLLKSLTKSVKKE